MRAASRFTCCVCETLGLRLSPVLPCVYGRFFFCLLQPTGSDASPNERMVQELRTFALQIKAFHAEFLDLSNKTQGKPTHSCRPYNTETHKHIEAENGTHTLPRALWR